MMIVKLINKITSKFLNLDNADLNDLTKGNNRSAWKHVRICPKCLSVTGHQEFMTGSCLSCGQNMETSPRNAATRIVFWNGEWHKQLRYNDKNYIKQSGSKWIQN